MTRDFLMDTHLDGIINIVDAANMERNLYLTMQLVELSIPVVPISAAKNEGPTELTDYAIHVARHRESPGRVDFCPSSSDEHDSVGAVHRCIHAAIHILEPEAKKKGCRCALPLQRWWKMTA